MSEDRLLRARELIHEHRQSTPAVVELAVLASLAVRIEPELLRALRLRLAPHLDVGVEGDLWFSRLVQARGADGITFSAEVAEVLQDRLREEPQKLKRAWEVISACHREISPALKLEEEVAFYALSGAGQEVIDRALAPALVALTREGRTGLSSWAARALPRLPQKARSTSSAWILSFAASRNLGEPILIGEEAPADLMEEDLTPFLADLGEVELGVRLQGVELELGEVRGVGTSKIRVSDTVPRLIEVRWQGDGQERREVACISPGMAVRQQVGLGSVHLRTLSGAVYGLRSVNLLDPENGSAIFIGRVIRLRQGQPIQQELSGGRGHRYELPLDVGQFANLVVEQRGIDVVVRLLKPDGAMSRVDSPNGCFGREMVYIIADARGLYQVEVVSEDTAAPPGSYEIRLDELRTATAEDRTRLDAWQIFQSAENRRRSGELDAALSGYQESFLRWHDLRDLDWAAETKQRIASVLQTQERFEDAIREIQELLEIREQVDGSPDSRARDLRQMADVLQRIGRFDEARDHLERALALSQQAGNREDEALSLLNLGRVLHRLGREEEAVARLDQLLPQIERLQIDADYYGLYIDVLMQLHLKEPDSEYDIRALEMHERRRESGFLGLLSERRENRTPRGGGAEFRPLGYQGMQELLDPQTLLLVFSVGEERSYLWCLASDGRLESRILPARSWIEDNVSKLSQAWSRRNRNDDREQRWAEQLSQALLGGVADLLGARRLVISADGALQGLSFAALPDPVEKQGPAPPLLSRHEIVYLPSASVLAALRQDLQNRATAPRRLIVLADPVFGPDDPRFGNRVPIIRRPESDPNLSRAVEDLRIDQLRPLPFSSREAEAISALLPREQSRVLSGFDVNLEAVKKNVLKPYAIVHFATHGLAHPNHPELSGLVLSQIDEAGNASQGFLHAHQIADLDLRSELVVLSACEADVGTQPHGEGMIQALTRSFMRAGAPRLVVTLWAVIDEGTAELMARFYHGIFRRQLSPAEALRSAQLSLLSEKRWSDPFYWAPFVFQGEWRKRSGVAMRLDNFPDDDFPPRGENPPSQVSESEPPNRDLRIQGRDINREILVNGIDGLTGLYLPAPGTARELALRATLRQPSPAEVRQLKGLTDPKGAKRPLDAPSPGVAPLRSRESLPPLLPPFMDPLRLDSAGWCVIFSPEAGAEVREALKPLLDLRRTQAGVLYQEHVDSVGEEEPKAEFLARRNAEPGTPDPRRFPYYVLLVGDPRKISYRFQYELDVQYAVGRLWLDRPEDYENYARTVVRTERAAADLTASKRLTFFGAANPDDLPTERLCQDLVRPLAQAFSQRAGWDVRTYLGTEATKARLASLLGGHETPGLLFTSSHGLGFRVNEEDLSSIWERQLAEQGALICQDWPGPRAWQGAIPPEHYFSAHDLKPGTNLRGLLAFLFACYSGGTPEYDGFSEEKLGLPARIANAPFVARLPKQLLASGALAVVAHIDRAWTTSFSWTEDSQPEVFKSVLTKLLEGEPLGWCMEYLNQRHAELSVELAGLFQDREQLADVVQEKLSRVWRANNDARNFVVFGDPAVRLTFRES